MQKSLNFDHQAPATLRHSRRCDDKSADNDKHTPEDPCLRKPSRVQDLAGDWRTDQQADGDDCRTTLAVIQTSRG